MTGEEAYWAGLGPDDFRDDEVSPDDPQGVLTGARSEFRIESMQPEVESLNLEFLPSDPAIVEAIRRRVAKDWAMAEIQRDEQTEGELWNLSK